VIAEDGAKGPVDFFVRRDRGGGSERGEKHHEKSPWGEKAGTRKRPADSERCVARRRKQVTAGEKTESSRCYSEAKAGLSRVSSLKGMKRQGRVAGRGGKEDWRGYCLAPRRKDAVGKYWPGGRNTVGGQRPALGEYKSSMPTEQRRGARKKSSVFGKARCMTKRSKSRESGRRGRPFSFTGCAGGGGGGGFGAPTGYKGEGGEKGGSEDGVSPPARGEKQLDGSEKKKDAAEAPGRRKKEQAGSSAGHCIKGGKKGKTSRLGGVGPKKNV